MNEKKINLENALYFYARMNKTAPFNRNEVVMENHMYKEYVKLCKIGEEIHKIFNIEQQRGD